MPRNDEKNFIADGAASVERVTGNRPVGWNANAMRNSVNTLEILHELGFKYFIDDLSRDEPFIIPLPKGEIGVVPYTAHLNDLHNLLQVYDLAQFELLLKEEFDQLYEEGASRRRMMVVSLHDRVGTRPASIRMFDRVFDHMRRKSDVWFARKDEVARWALTDRENTPIVRRGPAGKTGLPGSIRLNAIDCAEWLAPKRPIPRSEQIAGLTNALSSIIGRGRPHPFLERSREVL